MTTTKIIGILVALSIFGCLAFYAQRSLTIATGYVAKYVCSSNFVSKIPEQTIKKSFAFFPINSVSYHLDEKDKMVTASLWGMFKRKAFFVQKGQYCSCSLDEPVPTSMLKWVFDAPNARDSTEVYWPYGNMLLDSVLSDIDQEAIQTILDSAIKDNPAFLAMTVAVGDDYLAESYGLGISTHTRLLGWSMTKTMAACMVGAIQKEQGWDLDAPTGILEWQDDERKEITTRQLLQMRGGLAWDENYGGLSPITRMLYHKDDVYAHAVACKAESKPGNKWEYSSGTTNILSGLIKSKCENVNQYLAAPKRLLFDRIGMRSAIIEFDRHHNYVMSSYGWATARDWTRFGLLLLNKGQWQGQEVYSTEFADFMSEESPGSNGFYGAQVWLNNPEKTANKIYSFPDVPSDAYFENGFGGQRVLIIPSKNMVITSLSGYENSYDYNTLYKRILSNVDNG